MAQTKAIEVVKGKTFVQVLRWETLPFIYKPITAITQSAPVRLTVTAHGLKTGWRVKVESVKGMTNINDVGWQKVTVVDPNTIEFNEVNSLDFKAYTSGGVVKYYTPQDLAGYTARMDVKDKIGGTIILSLSTVNNRIVIDNTEKTIALSISASDTASTNAKKGVYDLELISGTGVVTGLLTGTITFASEVTTST